MNSHWMVDDTHRIPPEIAQYSTANEKNLGSDYAWLDSPVRGSARAFYEVIKNLINFYTRIKRFAGVFESLIALSTDDAVCFVFLCSTNFVCIRSVYGFLR